LAEILGYAPRADVVLTHQSDGRRLWIEFEVSRADPVANHAKFATAHLFQPQAPGDVFVSMVSRHINRGRRNLAANTILLMRRLGMSAFQTVLFAALRASDIQDFNHMDKDDLRVKGPAVQPEIERALAVSTPQSEAIGHRIYFAGEIVDVLLNARAWNEAVATPQGRALWGRRTVQYFVWVPYSSQFAPSKFCAFLPVRLPGARAGAADPSRMTLELYGLLDESESRFDGGVAHRHLTQRLGMVPQTATESPHIAEQFQRWLTTMADVITVHPRGAVFLCSPEG
jgi:hypothetical protein